MIHVDCELRSAIDGHRENLCSVEIANDGRGTASRGNYVVRLYARNNGRLVREARIENWPRKSKPAWRLIQAALEALGE